MLIEESDTAERRSFIPDLQRIRAAGLDLLELTEARAPRGSAESSAAQGTPDVGKEQRGEESAESSVHGHLLVVDDLEDNRALLVRRLEAQGHTCTAVPGGREAIRELLDHSYDVVLLDLMMPEMDGFAVLSRIKSDPSLSKTPVIMISASDELETVVRCVELGAADYLTKPFNPTLLRARVGACLREKRLRDREEQLYRELQDGYRRERRIADALQRSLIQEVAVDQFPYLSVATIYEAAWTEAQVGGDLFDAFSLPNGRVAFVVADASGKGLDAAARIAQSKYVLRAYARDFEGDPSRIITQLNNFLCDINPSEQEGSLSFVTCALAVVDPATGECDIVCAGCEPPLLLRASDKSARVIGRNGLPLGIELDVKYTAVRETLEPGDLLVMCTDGITEARQKGDLLGYDGMTRIVSEAARAHGADVRTIGVTLLESARAFGGGSLKDDACILLARRNES